jgi:uncharacterized protein YjbI with pentapeptide repeats
VLRFPTLFTVRKQPKMANPDHLSTLRQGVDAWNAWREREPLITPDLSKAKLIGVDLDAAHLNGANLMGADLGWAYLIGANLNRANLNRANLMGAYLMGANLTEANLIWAIL